MLCNFKTSQGYIVMPVVSCCDIASAVWESNNESKKPNRPDLVTQCKVGFVLLSGRKLARSQNKQNPYKR